MGEVHSLSERYRTPIWTWSGGVVQEGGIRPSAVGPLDQAAKRLIDIVGALIGLFLSAPLLLIAVVAIRLTSSGPAFYRGSRVGRFGRTFTMHKLRTMHVDAERQLADLLHLNVASGMVKIPDDPRCTRVGRLLRRLSIDELPQLWDVLRGEMSLVGPRPHVPGELDADDPMLVSRTTVRPGLTGLWQVSARTHPSIETRVRHDLDYISSWSLLTDLRILVRTVPAVLRADGGVTRLERRPEHLEVVELLIPEPAVTLATEPVRLEKLSLG